MKRTGRAVTSTLLVAIGAGGVALGLFYPSSTSTASTYLTDRVTQATVQKSISDSGTIVDHYTYSIAPKTDPVLTARNGVTVGQASGARGYTVSSLKVAEGDTVEKGDVLAVVTDADDNETKVKAPFDGRVLSVPTAEEADASIIATLGVGRREVVVTVSEHDVTRLKLHQNADLRLDANGSTFDGTIAAISQTAKATSGVQTYQVTIRSADLPTSARLGMTVTATIGVTSKADVLTVPLTAVSGTDGDTTVQVVDDQGVAHTRSVTVGLVGDSRVEITKGLQVGEEIVTGIPGAAATSTSATPDPADGGLPGGN